MNEKKSDIRPITASISKFGELIFEKYFSSQFVNLLYFPESIEIASLEGLTLW